MTTLVNAIEIENLRKLFEYVEDVELTFYV